MKYKYKKVMTACLAAAMLCTNAGGSLPVYGAEAGVDVDESMYVNLDYYGRTEKINVVKGCSLNGCKDFTDYGTYLNVANMSDQTAPVIGNGSVTWDLPQAGKERFYYKCSMDKSKVILPWDFNVSYKLNGVPTDGDKLAGASGLVEINVKAKPNDKAREYYRNNMMLMVAVPVDMEKCYSVDADGSQTQNLGQTTAVVFTALPGEDGDYTVRIGTDSFETTGVIMAMVPGTLGDLEHIKDLKKAKDTWKDAGDDLYDSLDQMAKSMEGMRGGVGQVKGGLDSAETARRKWSNSKDSILEGNDRTLASLSAVSKQMETMIPHLETAKDSAEIVHKSMGDIVNTLGDMQDPLRKLYTRLNNIKNSSEGISENIPELMQVMQQLIGLDAQLQASEQVYVTKLGTAGSRISSLDDDYYIDDSELKDRAGNSSGNSGEGSAQEIPSGEKDGGGEAGTGGGAGTGDAADTGSEAKPGAVTNEESSPQDTSDTADKTPGTAISSAREIQLSASNPGIPAVIEKHNVPIVSAPDVPVDMGTLMELLKERQSVLTGIAKKSGQLTSLMSGLMGDTSDAAKYSAEIVDNLDYLIEDLTALNDSLDANYPDLQAALDDSQELVRRTTDALNNGVSTMTIVQNTLKDSSNDFDSAARDSLRGSMDLLDQSLKILDSTTAMRHAGRTMKDTIDNELDKFDTDNRFLFMDPSAEKVSFTSDKNKAPKTLQIVLRTDEISVDDGKAKTTDAEVAQTKESPLRRMWNVLVQMWKAMVSIFKNR